MSGPITVTDVRFLPASQVIAQYHQDLDSPPDRLICVVVLNGNFTVGSFDKKQTAMRATEFFDAHTGNYLGITVG